jgi:chorismate synthase
MFNSLGTAFTVTSFGESHGRLIGVAIDGCPAGLALDVEDIQQELDRRKPGSTPSGTPRAEEDAAEILSGVFNGRTTGAPLCLAVWNKDTDSRPYEKAKLLPRPGHADYTSYIKYGGFADYRGGGRSSGRITAGFVMAGAVARRLLGLIGVEVFAHTVEIGGIKAGVKDIETIKKNSRSNSLSCADPEAAGKMSRAIESAAGQGDSLGGVIEGIATGLPAGLGEPVFNAVDAGLARALFCIPAVKGVEFGAGFRVGEMKGSENNDQFIIKNGNIMTDGNNASGVLGGITNGMPLVVRVAVKPTPSIARPQKTVDMDTMQETTLEIKGRHDACIVPRAVVVVEAMIMITLCDLALQAGILPRIIK